MSLASDFFKLIEGFKLPCRVCGQGRSDSIPVRDKESQRLFNQHLCPDCLDKYCAKDSLGKWSEKEKGLIASMKK